MLRYIDTKQVAHLIPDDQEGIPIEERFPNADLPESIKGAKVYTIDGREIIARPDPPLSKKYY